MSYIEKILLPDERVIYVATLHWVIYVPGLAVSLLGLVIGRLGYDIIYDVFGPSFAHYVDHPLGAIGLLIFAVGVMMVVVSYIRQTSTELAVTNRRIIAKYGYIARTTFEILVNRMTGSNFDQTVLGRLLGYGTVLVHGAGGDISPFDRISDPQGFHNALMQVLERARY